MTEFDEENVIRALRSAGTNGPTFAMTPLDETTRRGRAARRRRTALAGVGTTALVAVTVSAALAMPPLLNGQEIVPAPANDPTKEPTVESTEQPSDEAIPMTADEMIAAHKDAVFDALPDGFARLTEENMDDAAGMAGFALAERAPATDDLPEGMSGGIDLMRFPASDPIDIDGNWCTGFTEKGTVTTDCVDLEVDGETVQVQHWSQPGNDDRRAYEATRTTYEQPSGDAVVLEVHAWEDEVTPAPRSEAARAWVDAMHEQIVSIVLHPSFQPTEWQERRLAEAESLAAGLGDDWYVLDEPPAASVHPTEAFETTLPEGVAVGVLRDVLRDANLNELCAARTEDGIRRAACEAVPGKDAVVSHGVMADPEHGGDNSFDSKVADMIAYHERGDGSIVKVRLLLSGRSPSTSPDMSSLRPWLDEQLPDLVRAATSGW